MSIWGIAILVYFSFLSCTINIGFAASEQQFKWTADARRPSSFFLRRVRRQSSNVKQTYPFDGNFADVAVDSHNEARKSVDPGAADIREMSWDGELADIALAYSQQCVFEHSDSPSHSRFGTSVGENLYISSGIAWGEDYVRDALAAWDNERVDYDYNTQSCTPGKPCGHYTQMVAASTFKVGCGATLCSSANVNGRVWNDATLLVCNYGPAGNIVGQRPYLTGEPCEKCADPSDTCSDGLCYNPSRLSLPASVSWLDWGSWGECSATCGFQGRRYRTRMCSTFVSSDCNGATRQVDRFCANQNCPTNGGSETPAQTQATIRQTSTTLRTTTMRTNPAPNVPAQNECGEWSQWSSCSTTQSCSRGEQRRSQICTRVEGRTTFTQTRTQIRSCQTNCPNGGFGEWGSWSECICGAGLRYRVRSCNAPTCNGSPFEIEDCPPEDLC